MTEKELTAEDMVASKEQKFPKALMVVGDLAFHLGARNIRQAPGCWEHHIDETWWVAINPHDDPTKCSHNVEVPGRAVYVTYNEWPAGFFDAGGGQFAAGEGANEDNFIAAVEAAIGRIGVTVR